MIPAFHFSVVFTGLPGSVTTGVDSGFQSINGIKAILNFQNDTTGEKNETNAVVAAFNPVVLKRAAVNPSASPLLKWIFRCLNEPVYDPLPQVLIRIFNNEHKPLMIIQLKNVSLKSWALGDLDAEKSELLIEEITLDYTAIELVGVS